MNQPPPPVRFHVNDHDLQRALQAEQTDPLHSYDPFLACSHVLLAFRKVEENEHWMNNLASCLTQKCGEELPERGFCHVELVLQLFDGQWFQVSINKATLYEQPDGTHVRKVGTVHIRAISEQQLRKYYLVHVPISRKRQTNIVNFLKVQANAPFNFHGYLFNHAGFSFGAKHFEPYMLRKQVSWFCSELIVVMLQVGGVEQVRECIACKQSPNSIFRMFRDTNTLTFSLPPCTHHMNL